MDTVRTISPSPTPRLGTGCIPLTQLAGPPIGAALLGMGLTWPFSKAGCSWCRRRFGVAAPFCFAFAGSAMFVVLRWRQLMLITHDD
ncbi:hypothetical protein [Nonomuraea sp. NPDC049400]|uniref:hypothetical protein n=1 Tax=Nonomuraea sp. NPDC049400 TaxID=3364352 RepID=UPI0037BC64B2